ncbi:oligosaccharide flippase family protein [Cellulomonas terrae]|uniref:Uncharacterized protein n=1 Tax=Cellulomonas terrae TaxID=311234 RepID=A0A511JJR1_9CELL|nr:oligosaccharide flippase family protein [Cellulomonas terrae]GEL98119.1 hypothetical protein CTE05_16660 [Cellulomonas terrae]
MTRTEGGSIPQADDTQPTAKPRGGSARSMTITLVGNFFPAAIALATGPILAQSLGVEGRGQVAAATAPLGLAIALMTFGVPEAVSYAVARHPRLVRTAARNGFLLIILAGLLATAAVLSARGWLSGGELEIQHLMVVASLAVMPTLLLGVLRGIASGLQQWSMVAWEKVLASGLRLLVLLPLWLTGHLTPFTAVVVLAAMPVMGAIAYLWLPRRLPPPEADTEKVASTKAITGYGMRLWIGTISGVLLSRVDQTLITPLSSAYQLGLYVVAVNVSEIPLIIHRSVRDVTFVTDAHRSEDAKLAASARISTLICTVVALGLGLTMGWWLPILFGEEFAPAVPIAALLLVAVVLSTPGSIAGAGLSARGRPGLRSIALVIACVVNVGLLVVLVSEYGALGAAWATVLGYLLSSALNQFFLKRLFGVSMLSFYGLRRSDLGILRRYAAGIGRVLRLRRRR